ncbi:MAG: hypothetical protein FJ398_18530 [Verrucomicrobia bacterium]|nr:hypothetical protein [Verrucomicrobiota bacterium]
MPIAHEPKTARTAAFRLLQRTLRGRALKRPKGHGLKKWEVSCNRPMNPVESVPASRSTCVEHVRLGSLGTGSPKAHPAVWFMGRIAAAAHPLG